MADDLAARVALPLIDAGRCVHAAPVAASCTICVDKCPKQALIMNDRGLYIEVASCDGCGACSTACPEGAIAVPVEPAMSENDTALRAFAACRCAAVTGAGRQQPHTFLVEGPALFPCLHGLGLETLAQLYRRGVRELVLAEAPCETCASGSQPRLAARVSTFNNMLSPTSMDQVRIVELPPVEWRKRRDAAIAVARKAIRSALGAARQALLIGRAEPGDEAEHPEDRGGQNCGDAHRVAPQPECDGPAPTLPRINPQLCTGCLACVSACPNGVFALISRPGGRREVLAADGRRCTGCGKCMEACAPNSIAIVRDSAQSSAGIAFGRTVCRACGARFRLPLERADGRALCPNCRSANRPTRAVEVIR